MIHSSRYHFFLFSSSFHFLVSRLKPSVGFFRPETGVVATAIALPGLRTTVGALQSNSHQSRTLGTTKYIRNLMNCPGYWVNIIHGRPQFTSSLNCFLPGHSPPCRWRHPFPSSPDFPWETRLRSLLRNPAVERQLFSTPLQHPVPRGAKCRTEVNLKSQTPCLS